MRELTSTENPAQSSESYTVEELSLVDAEPLEGFDAITRVAIRLFGVPVALVSIVEEEKDRQFFSSQQGLPEPWASERQTPLSHSFCQHVKRTNKPLVVCDARNHPLVRDNLAIPELGVIAYLGVPIHGHAGNPIGALCVIEGTKRQWTEDDEALLGDLGRCVNDEIQLRAALRASAEAHERTRRYSALRDSIALAFMAPDMTVDDRFEELLRAGCQALGLDSGLIAKIDGDEVETLFTCGMSGGNLKSQGLSYSGSLSALVAMGQQQIHIHDLHDSNARNRYNLEGKIPGCYVGTPLIFDGALYGTLEFSSESPKPSPWTHEELSMLSIISMFACAHLGIFGQIRALRKSESVLLDYLLTSKSLDATRPTPPLT